MGFNGRDCGINMNYIQYVTKHHIRKFDNEIYSKDNSFITRREAHKYGNKLNKIHFKVRYVRLPKIIKDTSFKWLVYIRKYED